MQDQPQNASPQSNANCPSCGANIPLYSKAAMYACCPYCNSSITINEQAIELRGKASLLVDTPSCLAVGWLARLGTATITTLGRIQLQYDAGIWDEWWVQMQDTGECFWISQDETRFMLQKPVPFRDDAPPYESAAPGLTYKIGGSPWIVEEKNNAVMIGFQGQLPFPVVPNESMNYLDLAQGKHKLTISYYPDDSVEIYQGRYLKVSELDVL